MINSSNIRNEFKKIYDNIKIEYKYSFEEINYKNNKAVKVSLTTNDKLMEEFLLVYDKKSKRNFDTYEKFYYHITEYMFLPLEEQREKKINDILNDNRKT